MTTDDNTNAADGLRDYGQAETAGQIDASTPDVHNATDSNTPEPDADDDSQQGGTDIEKARREAARYRTRLRDVEAERNTLRDRLTNQQQADIDRACAAARLTERHVAAAGINLENMVDGESGLLDADRLAHTVEMARREFGVGRSPAANRQQATGTRMPGQSASGAFTEAFAPRKA
jgi:hypothetical protein